MKLNIKIGLLFAAMGYAIVVAIVVQYAYLHVVPAVQLLWLAPVTILWATEGEPPTTFALMIIAPLNALLYGVIAFAGMSMVQRIRARHKPL